jgi:uncharacterized membrane protein YoaK (UPF0700 family)
MPYSHPQSMDKARAFRDVRHLLPGAAALAALAGYVNSVVLGFFHTPVSHMTGAVSHLALDLANGHVADATASLSIVLGFLAGAVSAGIFVGALKLSPNRMYGLVMIFEGALLGASTLLLMSRHRFGLPAVAMACGLQNAMTSSYCGLMIRTTHVTGTMTDIGVMLGHWIRHRRIERWKLGFLTTVILSFGAGGWLGAMGDARFGPQCLGVAAVGCAAAGAVFWWVTRNGFADPMASDVSSPPRTSTFPSQ